MRTLRRLVVVLAGLVAVGRVDGDPPPAKAAPDLALPENVAEAVISAFTAGDVAAVKALARRGKPEPWQVVDELLARGASKEADLFSREAPGPDAERRTAYVASRSGKTDDPVARRALIASNAAWDANDAKAVLAAIDDVKVPGDDLLSARLLLSRAGARQVLGRLAEAETVYAEAADLSARLGWLRGEEKAVVLGAQCAHLRGDEKTAAAGWERGARVARARGDLGAEARLFGNLGISRRTLGDPQAALAAQSQALALAEEAKDLRAVSWVLTNLTSLHLDAGEQARALESAERALAAAETAKAPPEIGEAHAKLATVLLTGGEDAAAIPHLEAALRNAPGEVDLGETQNRVALLGAALQKAGEVSRALPVLRKAVALAEKARGSSAEGRARHNLAVALAGAGEYAEALACYERAHAVFDGVGDLESDATVLEGLATLYHEMGADERAAATFDQALERRRKVGDPKGVASTLEKSALVLRTVDDQARALERLETAARAWEAAGNSARWAHALVNLASVQIRRGNYEGAREASQRALVAAEAAHDERATCAALASLAGVEAQLGRTPEARALAARARGLAEGDGFSDRGIVLDVLALCADLELEAGSAREAVATARKAVELAAPASRGLGDEQAASARARVADVYGIGALASARLEDLDAVVYFLEAGRSGALLESLRSRERIQEAVVPAALRRAEHESRAGADRAARALAIARAAGDETATQKARDERARADDAHARDVERIQREVSGAADVFYPTLATRVEIEGSLRPDEALVLYGGSPGGVLAAVLTRAGTRVVRLGKERELMGALRAARPDDRPPADEAAIAAVRALLTAPLALPGSVTRVLVSPSTTLASVPFSLLFAEREVAYVPSGTTYRMVRDRRDGPGQDVLAIGDPAVATTALAVEVGERLRGSAFGRLPGSREEAKSVGDVVLVDEAASPRGLREALAKRTRWRALHLACHGIVDPEQPMRSSLALAPADPESGFLTALDVFCMKIPADLVVLSACETARGRAYRAEGIVGFTRAFMLAGAPRVLCSLWKVDDEATRALMTRFYALWNPKDGTPPMSASAALRAAQTYVREREVEAVDPKASQAAGHDVRVRVRPWSTPAYWAAWQLWGLPE